MHSCEGQVCWNEVEEGSLQPARRVRVDTQQSHWHEDDAAVVAWCPKAIPGPTACVVLCNISLHASHEPHAQVRRVIRRRPRHCYLSRVSTESRRSLILSFNKAGRRQRITCTGSAMLRRALHWRSRAYSPSRAPAAKKLMPEQLLPAQATRVCALIHVSSSKLASRDRPPAPKRPPSQPVHLPPCDAPQHRVCVML